MGSTKEDIAPLVTEDQAVIRKSRSPDHRSNIGFRFHVTAYINVQRSPHLWGFACGLFPLTTNEDEAQCGKVMSEAEGRT